jgi:hypothetical protein
MADLTEIGVLAAPGAGVSSWLGAISIAARHDRRDSLHVHGLDAASVEYLQATADALRTRQSPTSHALHQSLRFHAHSDYFDADFHLIDPDGDVVQQALRSLEDQRLEPFFDHLAASPVLWLFLDPDQDLANPDAAELDRRLATLMTLFAERRKRAARAGLPLPDVAVVLTKMDAHPRVKTPEQARRFALGRQPAFFEKLNRHAGRLRFFPTSAFGGKNSEPYGLEPVLQWTAEAVRRRQLAPRRRKFVVVVSLLALLGASYGAWLYIDRAREERLLADASLSKTERVLQTAGASDAADELRQRLLRERLDELSTELVGELGEDRLQEILRELDRLGRSNPGRSAPRLAEVRRTAERRREDRRLAEIRDAAEHQRPNLDELVAAFHRDFPESDRRGDIEEWRKGFLDRELQSARTAVRLVVATDAASLQRKADAIADFLLRFGARVDPAERVRMARAAELGARFAKRSVYRVRLKRSGNLTLARVQHVKIIVEGNPVKEFIAPSPVTTATWDKTSDVAWQAGDDVRAFLASQSRNWVNYGYYVVAERAGHGLFALRALSSLGPPHVPDAWISIFNDGQAYLDLEIEGLSADDWTIAEEFLAPGEKW